MAIYNNATATVQFNQMVSKNNNCRYSTEKTSTIEKMMCPGARDPLTTIGDRNM